MCVKDAAICAEDAAMRAECSHLCEARGYQRRRRGGARDHERRRRGEGAPLVKPSELPRASPSFPELPHGPQFGGELKAPTVGPF